MSTRAYVVSDLHVGAGPNDPLEDFFSDDLFASFINDLAAPDTTLIINGDFVDFVRIEPLTTASVPDFLLWRADASVAKLEAAIAGHGIVFDAISHFLENGGELQLTVGNHDLDFAWPQVQERFRERVGGKEQQVSFSTLPVTFAGVHIEHGHQFTPENCPEDPSAFLHRWNNDRYLERVWGTDFLLSFFNQLNHEHPYADKLKPTLLLFFYAVRNLWIPPSAFVRFVIFLKRRGLPWRGITSGLLDDSEVSPFSIVGAFEEDEWRGLANQVVRANHEEVKRTIAALDSNERAVLRAAKTITTGVGAKVEEEEAQTLGLVRDSREARGARDRLSHDGVTSVIFGHTHEVIDGDLDGTHFNPGCWIPHLNLRSEDVRAKIRQHGVTRELLSDASLYRTEPYAVMIRPEHHRSRVELVDIQNVSTI